MQWIFCCWWFSCLICFAVFFLWLVVGSARYTAHTNCAFMALPFTSLSWAIFFLTLARRWSTRSMTWKGLGWSATWRLRKRASALRVPCAIRNMCLRNPKMHTLSASSSFSSTQQRSLGGGIRGSEIPEEEDYDATATDTGTHTDATSDRASHCRH